MTGALVEQEPRASVRAFILSDVVTQFGAGMVMSASAWYIFDESRSSSLVAVASGFNTVSGILISIIAGSLVDRFRPKSVAQLSHLARIVLIAVPLLLFSIYGFHRAIAFLLALNNGLGWNLYFPASKAIIQRIAGPRGTVGVNSAAEVSMQIGLFSSGAVAGLVYHRVGFLPILTASALIFAVGIMILQRVHVPDTQIVEGERTPSFVETFTSGFGYLLRSPRALLLSLVLYAPFVVASIFAIALPDYTKTELRAGAVTYGVIDMLWGVGACVAGLLALKLSRRFSPTALITAGLLMLSGYGLAMTMNSSVAAAAALTAVAGFSAAGTRILLYSDLMGEVPAAYLGRVVAMANTASLVVQTILVAAAGVVMDATSARYGFLFVVTVGIVAATAFAVAPARRSRRSPLPPLPVRG